uniref:mRNA (guanine-N(7))-methyltransferase n=1 Tax=viral metagenome TaxID=1070528 RepID=A0A6C0BWK7_9ZZZZ
MEPIIANYLENSGSTNPNTEHELEIRFGTKYGKITKINYDNVIKKLRSIGFKLVSNHTENRLRIMSSNMKNVRCDIYGTENISTYCKTNNLSKIPAERYSFLEKSKPLGIHPYDNSEFQFRLSYQIERNVEDMDKINGYLSTWKDMSKRFRYISRITLVHESMPNVKVDMTITKSSKIQGGQYTPEYTIEAANVFNNPENYEIEFEILPNDWDMQTVISVIKKMVKYISSGLQETNYPIPQTMQSYVLTNYYNIVNGNPPIDTYQKYMKKPEQIVMNSRNFIGPNSITLQLVNIVKTDNEQIGPNITKNYTVTDKADGLRKLLIINSDGNIYLISTNMEVQFTGMKCNNKTCFNSILDGEHILYGKSSDYINLYASFDIYFSNGIDVRHLPFHDKDRSRYQLLIELTKMVDDSTRNIVDNLSNILKIKCKTFYASDNIFASCKKIIDNAHGGNLEYETDGLIFTPSDLGVGINEKKDKIVNKKKTWTRSFKWKPPEHNTVDFLVTTIKNQASSDAIYDMIGPNIERYKTLTLRCGFSEQFVNPCQNVIDDNIIIPKRSNIYKPAPFHPTNPSDDEAHICNIKLQKDAVGTLQMMTEDGDIFTDKAIVEFKYIRDNKSKWRWIPIKVRYDKTAQYLSGEKVYGNSYDVANSNWKSIHEPITLEMIITGQNIPEDFDSGVYYTGDKSKSKTKSMRNFHNLYVKNSLIMNLSNPGDTLIDYAVGKAGDLNKWKMAKLSFVLGVDVSQDNIENKQDGACVRYIEMKNQTNSQLTALFTICNSKYNLKEGTGFNSERDKMIYNSTIGRGPNDEKQIGKGLARHYGRVSAGFNISSCQFALHYFFEDMVSLRGFIRNVAENTKIGGYFVGTCYDGTEIFNKLASLSKGESFVIGENDHKLLEVTKQYDNTSFDNDSSCLGYAIDVLQETIGKKFREYLVNFNYLNRVMENYGFELLSQQEANALDMPVSSGNFSILFTKMLAEKQTYGQSHKMSENEKAISFLNRFFIYKKIRTVDAATVVLDDVESTTTPFQKINFSSAIPEEDVLDTELGSELGSELDANEDAEEDAEPDAADADAAEPDAADADAADADAEEDAEEDADADAEDDAADDAADEGAPEEEGISITDPRVLGKRARDARGEPSMVDITDTLKPPK